MIAYIIRCTILNLSDLEMFHDDIAMVFTHEMPDSEIFDCIEFVMLEGFQLIDFEILGSAKE